MQMLDVHNTQYSEFNAFRLFSRANHIDSERSNALIEQLQVTLDPEKLLNAFAMEASKYCDFSGLYFKSNGLTAAARGCKKAKFERLFELTLNNELVGVLTYHINSPIHLDQVKILNELHKCLLYPLRNALQYQYALSLAMQDALTSLGNRRYFDQQLKRAMHHAKRQASPLGLLVCDLNKFKMINDNFGHQIGDEILVQFSNALKASVRDSDSLFRFGGDEFVILVENASQQSLNAIKQRVYLALESNFLLNKYQVSCSLGYTFMNNADDERSLFDRADKALYHQKMSIINKLSVI